VRRLTGDPGYDGGPFFSWDGRFVVFRASRPETTQELEEYRGLLQRGLVRPRRLDIYVMKADGTGVTRVTRLPAASFAPFMHPDGQRIVFASNVGDPSGRSFALYLVNVDGSGLERVTWAGSFASFPMFTRDGRKLVFCSNRGAAAPRDLDVFVADWQD
jgi:Tol biopolymer transport system component